MSRIACCLLAGLLLLGPGCGGDPAPVTKEITAEKGGTLSVEGDKTQVAIPPKALAKDTAITVAIGQLSEYPELKDALPRMLKIDPPTTLELAATIQFDPASESITPTSQVSVYLFNYGEWHKSSITPRILSGGLLEFETTWLGPTAFIVSQGPVGSVEVTAYDRYERALADTKVELVAADAVRAEQTTDKNGKAVFSNVPVGSYTVRLGLTDSCGKDHQKTITVQEDQVEKVWLMYYPPPCPE